MRRKMSAEAVEETGKRKRFTMLAKDERVYRSDNSPRDEFYGSNTSHSDDNERHDSNSAEDIDIFADNTPIVNFAGEHQQNEEKRITPQRGRPKKKNDSLEWSDDVTELLIDLWRTKGELFDKAHPHFYHREMKDKAVEDVRDELCARGLDVTTNQILSKFQSLRTYFCSQRTKLIQGKKYGNLHLDAECKWRFFKSLRFLDDNMKVREGYGSKRRYDGEITNPNTPYFRSMVVSEDSNSQRDYQDSALSPDSDYNNRQNENGFYNKSEPGTLKSGENGKYPEMVRNDDEIFGELVGNMMQQIPSGQAKDLLKLEIQQLIIKSKYSVKEEGEKA